jgi:His-Xaa-Ser system protein HxsD
VPRPKRYNWRLKDNSVEITINAAIYPQEPLYATSYVFIEDYYILLDLSKDRKRYKITLTPKSNHGQKCDFARLVGEFHNELINNVLRFKIASRNKKLREWIVKEALFFSQPQKEQEKVVQVLVRKKNEQDRTKISSGPIPGRGR